MKWLVSPILPGWDPSPNMFSWNPFIYLGGDVQWYQTCLKSLTFWSSNRRLHMPAATQLCFHHSLVRVIILFLHLITKKLSVDFLVAFNYCQDLLDLRFLHCTKHSDVFFSRISIWNKDKQYKQLVYKTLQIKDKGQKSSFTIQVYFCAKDCFIVHQCCHKKHIFCSHLQNKLKLI